MKNTRSKSTIMMGVIVFILTILMFNMAHVSAANTTVYVSKDGKWKYEVVSSAKGKETARLVKYTKDRGKNIAIPSTVTGKNGVDYTIVEIGKPGRYLFDYSCETATLTIPAMVRKINSKAFASDNISKVVFASGSRCTYIGKNAFEFSSVKEVKFPASLEKIDNYAFANNSSSLTKVTFPDNSKCTTIGKGAFYYDSWLEEIVIPA